MTHKRTGHINCNVENRTEKSQRNKLANVLRSQPLGVNGVGISSNQGGLATDILVGREKRPSEPEDKASVTDRPILPKIVERSRISLGLGLPGNVKSQNRVVVANRNVCIHEREWNQLQVTSNLNRPSVLGSLSKSTGKKKQSSQKATSYHQGSKLKTMADNYGRPSPPARQVGHQQGQQQSPYGQTNADQDAGNSKNNSNENSSPQRHGSYTIIAPNTTRRNQILSQAESETKAYESFKEKRKVTYVETTPQTVGGSKSEAEIQKQRERESMDSKYRQIMKRRQWEAEKQEREEAEYREKKEKAREQTRRNQQRKTERQDVWKEDQRRTNEVFLRRLEQQSRQNRDNFY